MSTARLSIRDSEFDAPTMVDVELVTQELIPHQEGVANVVTRLQAEESPFAKYILGLLTKWGVSPPGGLG